MNNSGTTFQISLTIKAFENGRTYGTTIQESSITFDDLLLAAQMLKSIDDAFQNHRLSFPEQEEFDPLVAMSDVWDTMDDDEKVMAYERMAEWMGT